MPITDHPNLTPPSDDTVLWRYMNLAKFLSLVVKEELFFVNIPKLNDPFEGALPRKTYEWLMRDDTEVGNHNVEAFQGFRRIINVSCWHMNNAESDAMWNLYMPSGQGIAIRLTYKQFKEAFQDTPEEIHGGVVEYIDYEKEFIDPSNLYNLHIAKRESYSHEKEFRAFISRPSHNGVSCRVNVRILISDVYVSPVAPSWHVEIVSSLLKKYEIDARVNQSELYKPPVYLD